MPDIAYIDISEPANHEVRPLDELFAGGGRVIRSSVGPPAMSDAPPPPPKPLPALLMDAFVARRHLPSPGIYRVRDVTLLFHFALCLAGRFVIGYDYYPSFYHGEFHRLVAHYARLPQPRRVERLREPVYVPWLWKYHEYGHFLIEMLPRLLLISSLYDKGLRYPVLIPSTPAYVLEAAATLVPELDLITIDNYNTTFALDECLIPVDGSVDHTFHPGTAHLIDAAITGLRAQSRMASEESTGSRICLSRIRFRQELRRETRGLSNERELQEIARTFGFDVIEPQELSFAEQVIYMAQSSILVGEASSALHNAIFAGEADVISLGWMNNVQTRIAGLRSQTLTYVLPWGEPTPGEERPFFHRFLDATDFEIPRRDFEEALTAAIERASVSH